MTPIKDIGPNSHPYWTNFVPTSWAVHQFRYIITWHTVLHQSTSLPGIRTFNNLCNRSIVQFEIKPKDKKYLYR